MARLTTHVLDTAHGTPASAVSVRLFSIDGERTMVASTETNADGRTDAPLLDGDSLRSGAYELEFDIGDYFADLDTTESGDAFLGTVVIRVQLRAGENYHIPLLASPWSYSTYRGS